MLPQTDALRMLEQDGLDLGPFGTVPVQPAPRNRSPLDALLRLTWEGHTETFGAVYVSAGTPRRLETALAQLARSNAERPLVLAPYLSPTAFERLREATVSGADLSGNHWIHVPGRWLVAHTGRRNRYPSSASLKRVYVGTSSLVGRMLLLQPAFDSVTALVEAIQKRGGAITQPTVSKVLAAMNDDALIDKQGGHVTLKRPDDLLDRLVRGARSRPLSKRILLGHRAEESDYDAAFRSAAARFGIDWAAVAPPPRQATFSFGGPPPRVYVSRLSDALLDALPAVAESEFPDVELAEAPGPEVFFDARDHRASRLQTYLDLMQGGERERHAAASLRADLLPTPA